MSRKPTQEINVTTRTAVPGNANVSYEEIVALAYQHWLERGSPIGSPEIDWQLAEDELQHSVQSSPRAA